MKVKKTKREKIFSAVMNRYGGLSLFKECLSDDYDTVMVNLDDDLDGEFEYEEIEKVMFPLIYQHYGK